MKDKLHFIPYCLWALNLPHNGRGQQRYTEKLDQNLRVVSRPTPTPPIASSVSRHSGSHIKAAHTALEDAGKDLIGAVAAERKVHSKAQ